MIKAKYVVVNGLDERVTLKSLLSFEEVSWVEEERATEESLKERISSFPEGIFMLFDEGVAMAQFTMAPKRIPNNIEGFEQMRDLSVDRESKTLWGTNLSRRRGEVYSGRGYALMVVEEGLSWARQQGYKIFMGGVTLDGLKESDMTLEEYVETGANPATRVFERAARNLGMRITVGDPIPNYWMVNETSLAYGQMITIHLQEA